MLKNIPLILTIDLEEFDIPLEYGQHISIEEQLDISYQGLNNLLPILNKHKVAATFFTTAHWAKHYPKVVYELSQKNEIASHSNFHSSFNIEDYKLSKNILENITQQSVEGFRMPRLQPVDFKLLKDVGYTYDASMNPTFLPGRYNNFSKPIKPYYNGEVLVLPSSVTPLLRIPVFWLSFKNLPNYFNCFLFNRIRNNGFFLFYIHPWEFTDINKYTLPRYIKKPNGNILLNKLDSFLSYISKSGKFMTCKDFILHQKFCS